MARSVRLIGHCPRLLLALCAVAAMAGCAAQPTLPSAAPPTQDPGVAAARSDKEFAGLRRCMDNLLLDYGTRDVSVIVDNFSDASQRADAGMRDMLAAAVSDMTQRSRAIRLVVSDKDARARAEAFAVAPQFTLRGTLRDQAGGSAASTAETVLGLDLTLLATRDLSVVPGAASRNAVTLVPAAAGRPGHVELRKFGVAFDLPTGGDPAHDGRAVATRALLDVAAIELFGRVAKLPYWSCFGASAADASIAAEIQDWYDTMAARPAEIIGYFQQQLRTRGLYEGPIDGVVNPSLKQAVTRYREALGLSREAKLSLEFFQAYLAADHRDIQARLQPVPAVSSATAAPSRPAAASVDTGAPPLAVRVAATNEAQRFARGEAVQITVRPSRDAFVYCFHQDESRKIIRFFPNRFQRDARVAATAGVRLPGAMGFEIVMNPRGVVENVACFATDSDVLARLPANVNVGDFAPLPLASLEQVRSAFVKVSGGTLAQESFQIRPR